MLQVRLRPLIPSTPVRRLGVVFARSPSHISLPWYDGQVGPHIFIFEVCSAFTHVAACTLARSPIRDPIYPKASAISLPP